MKVKCDYCDSYIDETDEVCPHCGAPNAHMTRSGNGEPKTIQELLAFAQAHNLPLEKMRFFIGQDYREPKAFGIYQDPADGNFVVYKNKGNGQRVVRYRGSDEAFAVNEIYQKMRAELLERKEKHPSGGHRSGRDDTAAASAKKVVVITAILTVALIVGIAVFIVLAEGSAHEGYYTYGNDTYYYDDGWYRYDDGWIRDYNVPDELDRDYDDYYDGQSLDGVDDPDVEQYDDSSNDDSWSNDDTWSSDDWDDDDWDYDYDSDWDSGDTDWDSDWRVVMPTLRALRL